MTDVDQVGDNGALSTEVPANCSFCGKPNTAVRCLVAGPGVYICNECVELAGWVVEEAARGRAGRERAEDGPTS